MTSIKAIMKEPSKPKRNFLLENKGHLRKIEEQNREKKNSLPDVPYRNKKYDNVKPKVVTTKSGADSKTRKDIHRSEGNLYSSWGPISSKSSAKSLSTCDEAVQCNETSILASSSYRHQSTQTLDNVSETGYGDGKIIVPSQRVWTSQSVESLHLRVPREGSGLDDMLAKSQYTQRTHSSAEERLAHPPDNVSDQIIWPSRSNEKVTAKHRGGDPLKAPSSYQKGVVPRYLRERQEDQLREAERIIQSAPDPACPPGHRKLTEEERMDSLCKLKATQDGLIVQLNKLPVHLVTLRAQNQRHQLDAELDKIEKLIIAFTKPKVFVEMSE